MNRIADTALSSQDITTPLLVATYTADADRELLVQVGLSGLAGGGVYRACLTRQPGGAGAAYQSPTGAIVLETGVTTALLLTTPLAVESGDVVKVYAQGLAGDTSVGIVTEVFDTQVGLAHAGADDDTLKTLSDQLDLISSAAGAGSETVTLECLDASSAPLEGVAVWVTSDSAGATVRAGTLYSNSSGLVTVFLDPGSYFVWRQGGANWSNPQPITVTDV